MPPRVADWEDVWVKSWLQKQHRHLLSKVNVRGAHHTWVQRVGGWREMFGDLNENGLSLLLLPALMPVKERLSAGPAAAQPGKSFVITYRLPKCGYDYNLNIA